MKYAQIIDKCYKKDFVSATCVLSVIYFFCLLFFEHSCCRTSNKSFEVKEERKRREKDGGMEGCMKGGRDVGS